MDNFESSRPSETTATLARSERGRPGRPRSPVDTHHNVEVHVFVTPEQKQQLDAAATSRNLTLSGYIRLRSLGLPVIEPIGEPHQTAIVQLGELSQLLDQCLREGLMVERQALKDVTSLCQRLEEQLFSTKRRQQ